MGLFTTNKTTTSSNSVIIAEAMEDINAGNMIAKYDDKIYKLPQNAKPLTLTGINIYTNSSTYE